MGELQGADIRGEDMLNDETTPSEIVQFYTGSTILVTGGTGFLGRIFIEKLLRSCPDLHKIFVIIRPKKGKDVQTRLEDLFDCPIFENLKRKDENFAKRVQLIAGDLNEPNLGLSAEDQEQLISQVDCVIHSAATVRFDEKMKTAININIRSTRDLIEMAKKMKKLRAMLHISTAFSHCTRSKIDETLYDVPIAGIKLIQLADLLDEDTLQQMAPAILGENPNSYVMSKAAAEHIVKTEAKNLPIAVIRPSVVIASVKEPVAGWIDNYYGATGILVGAAVGLLRSIYGREELAAEIVPADYSVNCALAAAWNIATVKTINENNEIQSSRQQQQLTDDIPVYNFVSAPEARISWKEFMRLAEKHCPPVATPLIIWHYFFAIRSNKVAHLLAVFFYQTIPAYLVDFVAICIGKKPMLVKGYQKINKFSTVLEYFTNREWTYSNANVQNLWKKMSVADRETFEFSMVNFNWDTYFYTYVRGARVYLLKDPMDTLPQGKVKYYKLMVAHYTLLTVFALVAIKILLWTLGRLF